ncbi:MAG: thiamine diphosphokinase [Bacteroidales bacterium]|nr:thiamine diphosphokinase [Bacteroidales bacterium]
MKTAVILGAGDFPRAEYPLYLLRQANIIICCDDAFEGFLKHRDKIFKGKRLPDAVVGDMDSLSPKLREEYSSIVHHFTEQEHNDQTKAFRFLMEHWPNVGIVHILGATGKREVHTIGNMSLLMEYARECGACGFPAKGAPYVDMVSDRATIFALTDSCSLQVGEGRPVSIFSPDNSLNIKSSGLQWPLDHVVFDNWWKATLNRASADTVTLTFSHPSIALIVLE